MVSCSCSIVIPVFNSEAIVGETIERTIEALDNYCPEYELILVNDGSSDKSWQVIKDKAQNNPRITAINLLRNYGQHTALYCGLRMSRGDYVITLDDDLQNPPEEIIHLIEKAEGGHDLVFGRFHAKQHELYRRVGSRLIGLMNNKIFNKPPDLTITNVRLIQRQVVDRMCNYHTSYPYINGMALMFATNPTNVWVEHRQRPVGKSNYNLFKILELVMRILFNYSSYPLRLVSFIGIMVAVLSFLAGVYFLFRAIWIGTSVPGWASMVVLTSFLNGVVLLILGMLGEYLVRLLNQTSTSEIYHVRETINLQE